MAEAFDPLHKWLGIPPARQPPNHYQLLGIQDFESDADVISNAADQRMSHLRSFAQGRNSLHAENLLNQVASARVCLLHPQKKRDYDAELRKKEAPVASAPAPSARAAVDAAPVAAPAPVVDNSLDFLDAAATPGHPSKPAKKAKAHAKRKQAASGGISKVQLLVAGVLLTGLLLFGGYVYWQQLRPGTLVVEIDQPEVTVEVLSPNGSLESTHRAVAGRVSLAVSPGKHRLKLSKDDFETFAQEFAIDPGGQQTIRGKLAPRRETTKIVSTPPPARKEPARPISEKPLPGKETPPGETPSGEPLVTAPKPTPAPTKTKTSGDPWVDRVASLPAEEQVQAVVAKLRELNPRFDGIETHVIENNVVTQLQFLTDAVADIAPLRALTGLQVLRCFGSGPRKGICSDLTPLKNLKLTELYCSDTQVADLLPLADMKLTQLHFNSTRVASLTPLARMKLTSLSFESTQVSDLSPLKGMPLTVLYCHSTKVSNLSPLVGMSLTTFSCAGTPVSDLSPLKGMPLTLLACDYTPIADLSPLKGMPLTFLGCNDTKVSDLSPLKGMKLERLACYSTQVSDLSPLKGMPLTGLSFNHTPVSDLSPLKELPLKDIRGDFKTPQDFEILRSIKTLEQINNQPAAEFLKQ